MKLFRRRYELTVDTVKITGLDIAFAVERALRRVPNSVSVKVWNLNPSTRRQLEAIERVPVRLDVGYDEGLTTIFLGRLRSVVSERDGVDWVTTFSGVDRPKRGGRVRTSLDFGVSEEQLIRTLTDAAESVGIDRGNTDEWLRHNAGRLRRKLTERGVLDAPVEEALEAVARRADAEVSIQNGQLQWLPLGSALDGTAVRLAASTGLVGVPTRNTKASRGIVSATALLIPDLVPGRRVQLDAEGFDGVYRARKVRYAGDTAGGEWYATVELEDEVKAARRAARRRRPSTEGG